MAISQYRKVNLKCRLGIVASLGLLVWGCHHAKRVPAPSFGSGKPSTRLTVFTNRGQPIQYQSLATNDPQGNRVYRFVPNQQPTR